MELDGKELKECQITVYLMCVSVYLRVYVHLLCFHVQ